MAGPQYVAPQGGHPPQTDLLTGRAVFTPAYAVIPRGVMRDIVTSLPAVLGQDARLDPVAPAVGLHRDLLAIRHGSPSRRRQRQDRAGRRRRRRAVRHGRRGDGQARQEEPSPAEGRLCLSSAVERLDAEECRKVDRALPLDPQALRARRRPRHARSDLRERAGCRADVHAGHRRPLGDDALRRSGRPAPRHACQHRHPRDGRRDPLRGDPRHGAWPLCARGQGRLSAQPGLGRGRGRRLHVAARLLPAGLLRRRTRPLPLSALQGRQPASETRRVRR